jgi:hypothetical protein
MYIWKVEVDKVDLVREVRDRMREESVVKFRLTTIYYHVCKSECRMTHAGHTDLLEFEHLAFVDREEI